MSPANFWGFFEFVARATASIAFSAEQSKRGKRRTHYPTSPWHARYSKTIFLMAWIGLFSSSDATGRHHRTIGTFQILSHGQPPTQAYHTVSISTGIGLGCGRQERDGNDDSEDFRTNIDRVPTTLDTVQGNQTELRGKTGLCVSCFYTHTNTSQMVASFVGESDTELDFMSQKQCNQFSDRRRNRSALLYSSSYCMRSVVSTYMNTTWFSDSSKYIPPND